MSNITFSSLALAEPLLRALTEQGYETPTPIQAKAIPHVLAGQDLLAAAQTGTGKTAGFTLPILQRLLDKPLQNRKPGQPRVLIMTPTRELTAQVEASVKTYGQHTSIKSMVIFGGVNINPQISGLRKPIDILVATPGRLLDHIGQKTLDLSAVEILVLDEADRMLDMGFIRDIRKVLALLPKSRQNLLFSATFTDEIRQLARGVLNNPVEVSVAARNTTAELVDHVVYMVPQANKRDVLSHIISESGWYQVLVFTRTKHGANRLAEKLVKDGLTAAAIHGNKSQAARTRALEDFKSGKVAVLVATDIAARGIDIDQLPQVVNFELPNVPEDYVHRIGRTGRAGSSGSALSLVDRDEVKYLKAIEHVIKRTIRQAPAPTGWTPSAPNAADNAPRPPQQRRSSPRREGSPNNGNAGSGRAATGNGRSGAAAGYGAGANPGSRTGPRSGTSGAPRSGPNSASRSGTSGAPRSGPSGAPRSGPSGAPRSAPRTGARTAPRSSSNSR